MLQRSVDVAKAATIEGADTVKLCPKQRGTYLLCFSCTAQQEVTRIQSSHHGCPFYTTIADRGVLRKYSEFTVVSS
jgi:hypothetical protein